MSEVHFKVGDKVKHQGVSFSPIFVVEGISADLLWLWLRDASKNDGSAPLLRRNEYFEKVVPPPPDVMRWLILDNQWTTTTSSAAEAIAAMKSGRYKMAIEVNVTKGTSKVLAHK